MPDKQDQPGEPVAFRLFGGARIVRAGVEVAVKQRKQRAILAVLAASPGEPIALSELIDTLWTGEPAATVTNQIHRHIGALRRLCEPDLARRQVGRYLVTAGNGYRLVVTVGNCDVLQFRSLTQKAHRLADLGRREEARQAAFTALRVAAAPAGDDSTWTLPAFVGLEDERIRAVMFAVEHCQHPDEFADILPILRTTAGRHPLNENLHAHLMTALTHTGRGADALEVFATITAALRDELGAAAGVALRRAQAIALRGRPGDDKPDDSEVIDWYPAPSPVPAQLPSPLTAFAGRRPAMVELHERSGARGGILLITGMAGVGKTTLALRYAAEVAPQFPDGQLYVNLRGFQANAAPIDPLDALRDMLEGLGVLAQTQPESVEARSGLLRSILSDRQVLLLLDNARDYRQLEPLLPGAGSSRVVITSRNQMPGLAVFHQAQPIQLHPFDDDEVVDSSGSGFPGTEQTETAPL